MKVGNIKALAPFRRYVVSKVTFEEIGAQINLAFDKRYSPRCPECRSRLPRNKVGRRIVMDCPMSHGSLVTLSFARSAEILGRRKKFGHCRAMLAEIMGRRDDPGSLTSR